VTCRFCQMPLRRLNKQRVYCSDRCRDRAARERRVGDVELDAFFAAQRKRVRYQLQASVERIAAARWGDPDGGSESYVLVEHRKA
jgi:hypothetical protein